MEKSNLILSELILEGVIEPTEANINKFKEVIRVHLNNTFRDGVERQRMASNKRFYVEPVFED